MLLRLVPGRRRECELGNDKLLDRCVSGRVVATGEGQRVQGRDAKENMVGDVRTEDLEESQYIIQE